MSLAVDKAIRKAQNHIKAGDLAEAEELYEQVLSKFPKNKKAIQGYQKLKAGIASTGSLDSIPPKEKIDELLRLYNSGQFEEVLSRAKLLISLFSSTLSLLNIKGASEVALERYNVAIDSYSQVLKIKPNYAEAYYNIGICLHKLGLLDPAIDKYRQAIKIKPVNADSYNNIGLCFEDKGDLDAAIVNYRHAVLIAPNYIEGHYNIGNTLNKMGEHEAAIESYRQALKINPNYAEAYNNLGSVLTNKEEFDLAIENYEQAIKIMPDLEVAHIQKLHLQAIVCDWVSIKRESKRIPKLGISTQGVLPFATLAMEDAPERHRLRSEVYAKSMFKQKTLQFNSRPIQKQKCIRIGYFSADFHLFPGMHLMAGLFEKHDRNKFEVFAYSYGPPKDDSMRRRLIKAFDFFIDVSELSDKDVTLLARKDKIDIAIHRNGYTKNSRSGIFAYRAAPIQINFLGYPGTMGASFIDYIIADKVVIPDELQHCYSEKLLLLPHTYQPNDNTREISVHGITKFEMGLPEQGFVFCCFNNNYKISPSEFDVWMRLLKKVEGSVLWLLKSNKWVEHNLRAEAEIRKVSGDRLVFAERLPQAEHLGRHKLADLFLDTFNYNAHTTASDALWAGLPVVTKLGKGFAARVAGSLLSAINMPELITKTEQEYESLILDLATNPERLGAIKLKLAANRLSKPLFNTELFTKHLEDGYQRAYQQYIDGKEPEAIYVPEQV